MSKAMEATQKYGIEVGKPLILENLSTRRGEDRYRWVVVEKVGNKFFYVSTLPTERFFLETLKIEAKDFANYRLHLSLHKLTVDLLAQHTYQYLVGFFADYGNQQRQYDPEQLVEVCKILGVESAIFDGIRDKVGKQLSPLYSDGTVQKDDLFKVYQQPSRLSKAETVLTPKYQAVIEVERLHLCICLVDTKIGEKLAFPDGYEDQLKIYQTLDKRWIVDFSPVFDRGDLAEYIEEQLRSFGLTEIKVVEQ